MSGPDRPWLVRVPKNRSPRRIKGSSHNSIVDMEVSIEVYYLRAGMFRETRKEGNRSSRPAFGGLQVSLESPLASNTRP